MKTKFLILILAFIFNSNSSSQPTGNVFGAWNTGFGKFISIDTTFYLDSLGNQTGEIASLDSILVKYGNKLERTTWVFNNNELEIISEKLPGRFNTQFFNYKFLESGLLLTSKSGEKKYYIGKMTNDKLSLYRYGKNYEFEYVELIKNK